MRKILSIIPFVLILLLLQVQQGIAQSPPKPRDTSITGPQTFAMIMGISRYKYVRPLTYADKDAEMFRDFLKSPGGGRIPDDNIFCLLNEQALSSTFWAKGFKWLEAKKLREGDRLFIYLAGHGDAIDEDQFFYIAYDCNPAGDKNNYLAGGVIQLYNLKLKIQRETGKGVEVYFIMDACRTNELPGGREGQNFLNSAISEKRAGEVIMLATGAGQESLEDASIGNGHGLFTYYLVDGLTGLADTPGEIDHRVTLEEIQKYIDKNVPSIAQEVFKRKQDPYFCCNENSSKVVSFVDTSYLRRWKITRALQAKESTSRVAPRGRSLLASPADTTLIQTYNLFNDAVKDNRLTGRESAEFYYTQMETNYPGNSYTIDAQSTLAVEFINFAQAKINLYLDCRDASSIQRLRAQIAEDENSDEVSATLNRMEKVAQEEFYEVGRMLEKAIGFIWPDDPEFAKTLEARMYFFKARGYFSKGRQQVDLRNAFRYAYTAYALDSKAAYILNTLSNLHLDINNLDSAIYYAKKAIIEAPKWRYPYVTLAYSYKTQNKPDSAIRYYQQSIDVDPDNADAYVDIGHFYYSQSNTDSAIANYERALRIEPGNVYAANNIGWLYHDQKNYDESIEFFKKSIARDPRMINAYNGLAKTFFKKQEYDSARIYYEKAFTHYQDKSIVNVYIGNLYRDLGAFDSAKVYYRQAAKLDPDYEDAFTNLGKASFALKEYDSARTYYHRALSANPSSAFALINLGLVFRELKLPDSTYHYFQEAIRMEPRNPSVINNLGVIYGEEKTYDSAKNYFRRALQLRPDYKPAHKNLMKIFRELNELDSVTNFMKGSSFLHPGSPAFLNDLGLEFLNQKRYDSARRYFGEGIQQDPSNSQLLNNMGLVFQGMKKYDSARFYLDRAHRSDPQNPLYMVNLAGIFRQQKKQDSAAYYYKKPLFGEANPGAQAYYFIGHFFDDLKLYDSAVAYFRRAVELDNRYTDAWTGGGIIFMKMEMFDSARRYLAEAARLEPGSHNTLLNLGLAYHSLRQYDSAIVYIRRAANADASQGKTFYQLACSYALNNQPDLALVSLRQAYERGYKNTEALLSDPDLLLLRKYREYEALLDKYLPNWRERRPLP